MHGGDLHAAIASVLPAGIVQFNRKLVGLEQSGRGVTMTFADGTSASANALIGADGVHSVVREWMLGAEKPRYTGRVAYRTTFPTRLLGSSAIGAVRTKWWGPDLHMVVYYITANRDELYFVTSQPEV